MTNGTQMSLLFFYKRPKLFNYFNKRNQLKKMIIDVGARGNEISSCKSSGQYFEKQKSYLTFRALITFL